MVESEAKQKEMTIINDIADLVRILREDPAWADAVRSVLLSQELLNLPQEVVALTKAFREHAETTNRRLASLEAGQDELKQGQAQLQTTVDGLQNRTASKAWKPKSTACTTASKAWKPKSTA